MSTLAVVFPGQGSQSVGMLAALAEQYPTVLQTFDEASEKLSYSLWDLIQQGPATKLNETLYTQVAMLCADVAVYRLIKQHAAHMDVSIMAGHSLGEYAALVCSEALQFQDAIHLVQRRAQLMQQHVPIGVGSMAAIVGLDNDQVAACCQAASTADEKVMPANYNAIGQVVVAGHTPAVARVVLAAEAAGARLATVIPVSVPCHCDLLRGAAADFAHALSAVDFKVPKLQVLSNVDAKPYRTVEQMRQQLHMQLYMPVQWVAIVQSMVAQGINRVMECGPGQVLCGLMRRIDRALTTQAINDPSSFERLQ